MIQDPISTKHLRLHEFFQDTPYVVPAYQRDYAWVAEEHVRDLLIDIGDFIDNHGQYYLLGQVIVCHSSSGEYELIDGQQRVTSLMLILIWISTQLKSRRRSGEYTDASDDGIMDLHYLIRRAIAVRSSEIPRRLLNLTANDGAALLDHPETHGTTDGFKTTNLTQERMCDAWDEIETRYGDKWQGIEEFTRAARMILERVFLIRLTVDNPQKAFATFERINNRGADLNGSDLLKNLLFQKMSPDDYVSITKHWDKAAKSLFKAKSKRLQSIGYLLRALAQERADGAVINSPHMYDFWVDHLDSSDRANHLLGELDSAANALVNLSHQKIPNGDQCPWLVVPTYFGFVQHFPILLASRHLQLGAQMRLARLVQDRVIMGLLAEERPQDFEAMVAKWVKRIKNLPASATEKDVDAATREERLCDEHNLRTRMLTSIKALRYPSTKDRKRLRMLLALTSHQMELECREPKPKTVLELLQGSKRAHEGFDIDHVWPKNLANPVLDEHKHRLGNLVLVFALDQRAVKDIEPAKKVAIYADSKLHLTAMLAALPTEGRLDRINRALTDLAARGGVDLMNWGIDALEVREAQYLELLNKYLVLPTL